MQILAWRYFEGPNPHCHRPMIEIELELGRLAERTTQELLGFTETLLQDIPGLGDHHCSLGYPGGFLLRLREGTRLGHVLEHVALELLHLCGAEGVYGKTRQIRRSSRYRVAFEAPEAEVGHVAAELACRYLDSLVAQQPLALADGQLGLQEICARRCLGPSTRAITQAALQRDIPVRRIGATSILELGHGRHMRRVQATLTDRTSAVAVDLAADKQRCKEILAAQGIPVPRGRVVESAAEAVAAQAALGCQVAVKPLASCQGRGVTLGLTREDEIREAFEVARTVMPEVLVEEQVQGRHYRLLVVGGRLVAAAQRLQAQVTGDGRSSVRELVAQLNLDPRRGVGHEKPLTRVPLDAIAVRCLSRQGLTPDDVPPLGRTVMLREAANLSTGGSAVDVTDDVAAPHRSLAQRAALGIGLDVAGVDMVAQDIADPGSPAWVLEVNAAPGIRMHHHPTLGEPRDAAGAIVEALYPPGSPSRVPLVAITGSNGKTTTVRLVRQMLEATGLVVGYTCTDGHGVGGDSLGSGDDAGPRSARAVLRDPRVEAAVLEVARGGIARGGLGYDRADVGCILNVTGDHLGQDGVDTIEQLRLLKALVAEAVRPGGRVVLNADDSGTPDLQQRAAAPAILFAAKPDGIVLRRHVAAGGEAVVAAEGQLAVVRGGRAEAILPLSEIAVADGGAWQPMLENALAAAACAVGLGLPPAAIASALRSFRSDSGQNPGRLNVHELGDVRVVVDYGHNAAALSAVAPGLRAMAQGRLIGVVGLPGDRRDEDALALGRTAALAFDVVFCKEDQDRRGRAPGEMAQRVAQGVRLGGGRPHVVPAERDALREALGQARAGDVVAVFYEKLQPILEEIARWRSGALEGTGTVASLARRGGAG